MFVAAAAVGVLLAALAGVRADVADRTLSALRDPEQAARLAKLDGLAKAVGSPLTAARVERLRERKREEADLRRAGLLGFQKSALARVEGPLAEVLHQPAVEAESTREVLVWAGAPEKSARGSAASPWGGEAGAVWVVLAVVRLGWVLTAAIFRGGVSMMLTGIAVVRGDGRRASRRQCAVRAAAVWLPVVGLLSGSV
jgi:hypothetical protein